ncbi:hypothetical protein D3C72_496120 [compost metagenome]
MKKVQLIVSFLLLGYIVILSCGKKEYGCAYPYNYRPFGLAFVGYDSAEVAQLVMQTYAKNTNYTQLISSDTMLAVDIEQRHDTIFQNGHMAFFEIKESNDYKIKIINTGEVLTIDSIQSGPATYSWTSATPCSPGAGQPRLSGYSSIRVNGVVKNISMIEPYRFAYYLTK